MDFIYDPSLVLYLPLWQLDSDQFASKDAYGHLCTVTGASWRPNGRLFGGTGDLLSVTTDAFLKASISVECWFKPGADATDQCIWSYGIDHMNRIFVRIPAGDDLTLFDDINDEGTETVIFTDLPEHVWYHLVVISDANGKSAYLDLVEKIAPDASGTDFSDLAAGSKFFLGDYITLGGGPIGSVFTGTIGEVRLYRRALSALEVQHNYLATKWRYK